MWDSRSRRLSMRPRRTRALARWDRPDQVVSGYRPLPPFHPTLESLRQMPMHALRSHGGLWCETWPLPCIKCGSYPSRGCAVSAAASTADESHIPTAELRKESDKLRIDLLSVSPKHPMRPPLSSTNLTFLINFACLLDVASAGRMRSASPCRRSVGTVLREMSWRKSSIHESTQVTVPVADAPAATFQFASTTRSLTSLPAVTS